MENKETKFHPQNESSREFWNSNLTEEARIEARITLFWTNININKIGKIK